MENENGTASKTITLKSSEGEEFVVPEAAAMQSQLIRRMIIEDDRSKKVILLTEVNAQILAKVIDYCEHQAAAGDKYETEADGGGSSIVTPTSAKKPQEELSDWEKEFLLDVSADILDDLSVAAQYLEIDGLLHLIDENCEDTIDGDSIWEFCQTISFDVLHKAIINEEEIAIYEEQIGATLVPVSGSDKISASNDSENETSKLITANEREASRLALDQVRKTVEVDNSGLSWDLERLEFAFLSQADEFSASDDSDS